jgi:hypothetical protein
MMQDTISRVSSSAIIKFINYKLPRFCPIHDSISNQEK